MQLYTNKYIFVNDKEYKDDFILSFVMAIEKLEFGINIPK